MKNPNILVVDDEIETRNTIKGFLKPRIKCNIYEAENGGEALKILKKKFCDIMILDIRMPKKNGIRVLDETNRAAGKNVDTLVITAWDSELVAEECSKRNVECIPKPIILSEFYDKIVKILKKKHKFFPRS